VVIFVHINDVFCQQILRPGQCHPLHHAHPESLCHQLHLHWQFHLSIFGKSDNAPLMMDGDELVKIIKHISDVSCLQIPHLRQYHLHHHAHFQFLCHQLHQHWRYHLILLRIYVCLISKHTSDVLIQRSHSLRQFHLHHLVHLRLLYRQLYQHSQCHLILSELKLF